jgi:hypothetical protein
MARFARKSRIDDALLVEAIERAEKGLIDADLGGGVIKQRVGRPGQGRSGGYRTLIAYRVKDRAFFIYAFAKNERDNIDQDELRSFRDIGGEWMRATDRDIEDALRDGRIQEVTK